MLFKQILTGFAFKVLTQFLTLIAVIIIARIVGAKVLGELNFAASFVMFINPLLMNSLASANISLKTKSKVSSEEGNGAHLVLNLGYVTFIQIGVLIYAFSTFYDSNIALYYTFLILIITEYCEVFYRVSRSHFTSEIDQFNASLPDILKIGFIQIFKILAAYFYATLVMISLAGLIGTILMIPLLFILFFRNTSIKIPKFRIIKIYFKESTLFMSFTLTKLIPQYLDKIVLGFITSFSIVGYYTVGQKVGSSIEMIAFSIGLVLFPYFSKMGKEQDHKRPKKIISNFLNFFLNFIVPGLIFLCFFSKILLINIFGAKFGISQNVMIIYIFLGLFSIFMMPFNNVVIGFDRLKIANVYNLLGFLVFIVGLGVLFLFYRDSTYIINLMASIRLISLIVITLLYVFLASNILKTNYNRALASLLINCLSFIFFYNFLLNPEDSYQYHLLIALLCTIVCLISNYIFGFRILKVLIQVKNKFS